MRSLLEESFTVSLTWAWRVAQVWSKRGRSSEGSHLSRPGRARNLEFILHGDFHCVLS